MNPSLAFQDEIDLSRFNSLYRTESVTDAAPISYLVPDGRYEVVIVEAILTRAQKSGNPMIRYLLRIKSAKCRDRILRKYQVITENTLSFVRQDLELCGLKLDRFEDLKARIRELEEVELEVVKTTKGDDANVYFSRAIASRTQADGVAEDDLPF
jgi:hypothetical protein